MSNTTMTCKQLQEKHPKAFALFFKWYWGEDKIEFTNKGDLYFYEDYDGGKSCSIQEVSLETVLELRRWYDFFDEQEVYISLEAELHTSGITDTPCFEPRINNASIGETFGNRPTAEKAVFMEAFSKLEEELNHIEELQS